MGEFTGIGWCDHTFNPWEGCIKVSAECDHCYAEARDQRWHDGKHWGKGSPRRQMSEAYWKQLRQWDRKSAKDGVLRTVFCGSLCDVMEEHPEVQASRQRLFDLIPQTQHLVYLLLTKRPQNFRRFLPQDWIDYNKPKSRPWNVCAMTTVGEQKSLWRIRELLKTPTRWRAVSYEPALEWVSFADYFRHRWICGCCGYRTNDSVSTCKGYCYDATGQSCDGEPCPGCGTYHYWSGSMASLDWVICGGESGPKARPFAEEWMRRTILDAHGNQRESVPVFAKQLGSNPHRMLPPNASVELHAFSGTPIDRLYQINLKHKKGEDPAEWPADLRVQEFPDWLSGVPYDHPLAKKGGHA